MKIWFCYIILFCSSYAFSETRYVLSVGCGGGNYIPQCHDSNPECHWMLGGGVIDEYPVTVIPSEYGTTLRAQFSKTWGKIQYEVQFQEFIPVSGKPQYMSSMDLTFDGTYHSYTQSRNPPGEAFLFNGIVTPENKGYATYCSIMDLKELPQ